MRFLCRGRQLLVCCVAAVCCLTHPGLAAAQLQCILCQGGSKIIVDQAGTGAYTDVQTAINHAVDCDEVHVLAGVYEGGLDLNANITLSCESPDLVTLRNSPAGGNTIVVERNHQVAIRGCKITGGGNGIGVKQGTSATIANNVMVMNGAAGIRNLEDSVAALLVENNVISSNTGDGVMVTRYNCCGGSSAFSATFSNNIMTDNHGCGVNVNQIPSLQVSYNDATGNSGGDYCGASSSAGGISQSPRFVDASTGDYRLLQSVSPCVDAGKPALDLDPDGTRNDMGAFGGPCSADFFPGPGYPPSTITSLSLTPSSVPQGQSIRLQATGRVGMR